MSIKNAKVAMEIIMESITPADLVEIWLNVLNAAKGPKGLGAAKLTLETVMSKTSTESEM